MKPTTKLEARIARIVDTARTRWFQLWIVSITALCFTTLPWLAITAIAIIGGIVSYFATLIGVSMFITANTSQEEIAEAIREKNALAKTQAEQAPVEKPEDVPEDMFKAGFTERVDIVETSASIGAYQGVELYEWVEVKTPSEETSTRFEYFGPAQVINGIQVIPEIVGKLFLNIEGVLYSKELEPTT